METFVYWITNKSPPWAAYHSFMSGFLVELDKQTGVCLVGVGEIWRRIFSKVVLKVIGPEAAIMCHNGHLCNRLKEGINGAVHGVQAIWVKNLTTEDWGFLLLDAKNRFNEINKIGMLCTVHYVWPSGSRFFLNCYHH